MLKYHARYYDITTGTEAGLNQNYRRPVVPVGAILRWDREDYKVEQHRYCTGIHEEYDVDVYVDHLCRRVEKFVEPAERVKSEFGGLGS